MMVSDSEHSENRQRLQRLVTAWVFVLASVLGAGAAREARAQSGEKKAPRLEVLFVLDSTGSMSGEIEEAKRRILGIAASIASGEPRPEVQFGIVTYRDRGDAYVTRRWPLDKDWEATRAALASIRAGGGGDSPESVIQALHEGIRETRWTLSQDVMKLVYLIGDAPPKRYADDPDIDADLRWAAQNGIVLQSIGCGGIDRRGRDFFDRIARLTEGHYHALTAAAAFAAPLEVHDAEELGTPAGRADAGRARHRPTDLASVVSGTARTLSGELGVSYDEAEWEAVTSSPVATGADIFVRSGLLGAHTRIVRDARTWRLLWAAHVSVAATPTPPPPVDFGTENVVVVSLAEGGIDELLVGERAGARRVRVVRCPDGPRIAMRRVPSFEGPTHFDTSAAVAAASAGPAGGER